MFCTYICLECYKHTSQVTEWISVKLSESFHRTSKADKDQQNIGWLPQLDDLSKNINGDNSSSFTFSELKVGVVEAESQSRSLLKTVRVNPLSISKMSHETMEGF